MLKRLVAVFVLLALPMAVSAAGLDLTLKDFAGKDRNVREFIGNGQWTLVTVWSADCPICKREMYHMTFFHEEHKSKGARVLGLSIDGVANRTKSQHFVDDQGLNFPNLIGEPDDASRLSGQPFIGTPTYYFFAPDGKLAAARVGPVTQTQAENLIRSLKQQRGKG